MTQSVLDAQCGPITAVAMGLPGDHAGKTATRVFIVKGSDKIAVIDSGLHGGLPHLKQGLQELSISVQDLNYLLLTHEHMDHVGNNGWIRDNNDTCLIMGHVARADRVADNMLNATAIVHAFPEGKHFDLHVEYLDWMGPTAGAIDRYIREGDVISLGGGVDLEVLDVGGHAMHELGFYERSSGTLIIADPLLPSFNPVLYLYECPRTIRETFDKIETFLTERHVKTVMFAHDDPKNVADTMDLIQDCRTRVDKVEHSILTHIKACAGITFADLRDKVCDDQHKVHEWRALVSIDASLKVFTDQGLVVKKHGGWHYVG